MLKPRVALATLQLRVRRRRPGAEGLEVSEPVPQKTPPSRYTMLPTLSAFIQVRTVYRPRSADK